ncbi:MAG: hypothetical protein II920_04245 [Clostridia bacterium]|nr:hypothetical protein [Clostridia bacterium]
MKKISMTLLLAAVIVCLTVSALAAGIGIVFSKKVDNEKLAEEALLSKYGITSEMLSFFSRSDEKSDGNPIVCYEGIYPFTYVLGNYTVLIRDGKAEASWSRDGMDTSGGFDAEAWGAGQLSEMLHGSPETHDVSAYAQQALSIAVKNGAAVPMEPFSCEVDADALIQKQKHDAETAERTAKLSVSEMEKIAREALQARYDFVPQQTAALKCEEKLGCYLLFGVDEIPCYEFYFILENEKSREQGIGTGRYIVIVNVETGTVEDILYGAFLQYCYELSSADRTEIDEQELTERRNAEKAQSAALLSISEMEKLAREAIAVRYSFDAKQSSCLNCEDENGRYLLYGDDGLPCYEFYFSLGFEDDGYNGPGAGIYIADINVEDGTIEGIMYDSVLAGNG